jgi:hypothetical protein
MERLIELTLIHRILPAREKHTTIIPIPKPQSKNDRRPISLMDTMEAYIAVLVAKTLAAGFESTSTLHPHICAYRKDHSVEDLTIIHTAILEDTHQHRHTLMGHLSDDEEKFFDRITPELIFTALHKRGCPEVGYVEWAAETIHKVAVTIITWQGHTNAKFKCGIKQGSATSCPYANAVVALKAEAWRILPPQNLLTKNQKDTQDSYTMHTPNKQATPTPPQIHLLS